MHQRECPLWQGLNVLRLAASARIRSAEVAEQASTISEACRSGEPLNVANATSPLNNVMNAAIQLKQSIEATSKILESLRIPASLNRFEKAYRHFLESQNIRWLLVDVLLPLGVAAYALFSLLRSRPRPVQGTSRSCCTASNS